MRRRTCERHQDWIGTQRRRSGTTGLLVWPFVVVSMLSLVQATPGSVAEASALPGALWASIVHGGNDQGIEATSGSESVQIASTSNNTTTINWIDNSTGSVSTVTVFGDVWQPDFDGSASNAIRRGVTVAGIVVLYLNRSGAGVLVGLNKTGEIWNRSIESMVGLAVGYDGYIYYVADQFYGLDPTSGVTVRSRLLQSPIGYLVPYRSGLAVLSGSTVAWLRYDGSVIRTADLPNPRSEGFTYSVSNEGGVFAVNIPSIWICTGTGIGPGDFTLSKRTPSGSSEWSQTSAWWPNCNAQPSLAATPDGGVVTNVGDDGAVGAGVKKFDASGKETWERPASSDPGEREVGQFAIDMSGLVFQTLVGSHSCSSLGDCQYVRVRALDGVTGIPSSSITVSGDADYSPRAPLYLPADGVVSVGVVDNSLPQADNEFRVGLASGAGRRDYRSSGSVSPSAAVLGDSYSSGEGAAVGGWVSGTAGGSGNGCHRSTGAFGMRGMNALGFDDVRFAACSGATTGDILSSNLEGHQGEGPQLDAVDSSTSLVTLTIGGNDVGFANIASYCVTAVACEASPVLSPAGIDVVAARIDSLFDRLAEVYRRVKARAPNATVVVYGYPQIFSGTECGSTFGFEPDEQLWFRARTHQLNQVIALAAEQEGVNFADTEHLFDAHLLCSPAPMVNGFPMRPPEVFHPNVAGHQAWAAFVPAPILGNPSGKPVTKPVPVGPGLSVLDLTGRVPYANELLGVFHTLVPFDVVIGGLSPGAGVRLVLHSSPVDLGSFAADSNGEVRAEVVIPEGTAAGLHTIDAQGVAADGTTGMGAAMLIVDSTEGVISTIAGNGTAAFGGDNGPGTTAALSGPGAVAVDGAGNVFIADTVNNRVRKLSAAGTITTIAGTGTGGSLGDGGPAVGAQLKGPSGIAVDDEGNVYVADTGNHRVRKIDTTGVITTLAGTGAAGFGGDGSPAASALLSGPVGVAVGPNGELYVADAGNQRVRRIDRFATITTVAGTGVGGFSGDDGPGSDAQLKSPKGVAVNADGDVFVADTGNNRVRRIDPFGTISTVAGDGTATVLNQPAEVAAYDTGNLVFIADTNNNRVRRLDLTTAALTTIAGTGTAGYSGDGGAAATAKVDHPAGVAVDPLGTLTIADTKNHRARSMRPASVSAAPTQVLATPGNSQATVAWTAADDGGTPITSYSITATPGNKTCTWSSGPLSCIVSGLTNGTSYTFTARATNVMGTSPVSAPSNAITPAAVPGTPTAVTATRGNAQATVAWTAPAANGAPITGYTVTASPGGSTCSWSSGPLSCTVPGLTNGTAYTFTVTATNSVGTGPASAPSNQVTPATTPGAPTNTVATAGNTQATVTWVAPGTDGGAPITGYTVTAIPGGKSCAWDSGPLTCTVTGLANGTGYTFTVTARNGAGTGPVSTLSNTVTPQVPPSPPGIPTAVVAVAANGSATVSWTAPASSGTSPITSYTVTSSPGAKTCGWSSGPLSCTVTGLTNGTVYTFKVTATNTAGPGPASAASSPVTPVSGSYFHPLAPTRVLDSRGPNGGWNAQVTAGAPKPLTVTGGTNAVPTNVDAVVINVTVTGASAGSFLTVYPAGTPVPNTSSLNFGAGETIPNLVTVKVGANGQIAFANAVGATDVIVDLVGYYNAVPADRYNPITPNRILDSRGPNGGWNTKLTAGTPKTLPVRGRAGIPATADAVIMNITATGATANSFLTVYPAGGAVPTASNVNFAAGQTIPNLVTVKLGADGTIALANAVGAVDVIADVVGYYDATTGDLFHSITPTRTLDSRGATGGWNNTKLVAGTPRPLTVTTGPVPVGATAVIGNLTVTAGTANSYVTAYPTGQPVPVASNVNFAAGQTIPNMTAIKAGTNGQISFNNNTGATHIIYDTTGYYTPT